MQQHSPILSVRSQGVADSVVIARVNGELWDLDRPMEGDSTLELLTFENEDAQAVSQCFPFFPAKHF